jgi:hypothetical protein
LPRELQKLKGIVDQGLEQTAEMWPEVRVGFDLIHRAAHELGNERELTGKGVRRRYKRVLDDVRAAAERAAPVSKLRKGLEHFLKVTESYGPGLFHCYDVPDLPRTNNDLEHLFGSTRHHERRCTGRKAASPGLVLRGSVRTLAGLGTRGRSFSGEELAPTDLNAWQQVRDDLERRRESRVLRYRFRRRPAKYLERLETILLNKSVLPS